MHPKALLEACTALVAEVLKLDRPADAAVSQHFREHRSLGSRERAVAAETAYAVLRRKALFEHLAASGSGPRARRLAILAFAGPRDVLQAALTGEEQAWLARCDAVDPAALPDALRHNLPEWLAEALRAQVGDEFPQLVAAFDATAPLDLRANALRGKREEARRLLAGEGVASEPTPYSPWGLRVAGKPSLARSQAFTRGLVEVQDEGSQLLALLLDGKRGQLVVDFCAGAGGKTLALGAAMRDTGRLYAFDVSAHRLQALQPRLARAGLTNVHPAAIAHERDERIGRLAGKADRVIVDAPCSGLGTLRRNPDLKWRQDPREVEALAHKQLAILEGAARLPKPGGRLVYATCSVLPRENEEVAAAFCSAHPGWRLLPARQLLEQLKVPGGAGLCGGPGGEWLRLWPHRHGTDGFFAAVWERGK
jgi:16S rRNA (cytosine967-C5)-methyltransferase